MVKRYKQFDSLVVDDFEVDEWKHPVHNHNHFELIHIAKGEGWHHLNRMKIPYRSGDLFLLGPEDQHEFEIRVRSRFMYFKFTKPYITDAVDESLPGQWNHDMDRLLYSPERKKGNLLSDSSDRELVHQLMQMIVQEYRQKKSLHEKVVFQWFATIIMIILRNATLSHREQFGSTSGITEEILEYIDLNIYDPSRLTLKKLAEHFHYSANYIGPLFREKVGCSLRDYIHDYRYRLIEQRLKYGHIGVKQIASEFGFVDASHVYKFVRSRNGKKLSEVAGR